MFLFPISAFITWKWLLWKILIKHRLFPGWTETGCYSYSIAWHFALCAGSSEERVYTCVCVCTCVHVCVVCWGEQAVAAVVSVSPSSVPSSDFVELEVRTIPLCRAGFLLYPVQAPWPAAVAGRREGDTCVSGGDGV